MFADPQATPQPTLSTAVALCLAILRGHDRIALFEFGATKLQWFVPVRVMFIGIKMRVARHLLVVLLVPDKRGPRNIAASIGLALYAAAPDVFRLGSVLYVTTVLLFAFLAYYLRRIGWATVRDDARHPLRTVRLLLSERRPGSLAA